MFFKTVEGGLLSSKSYIIADSGEAAVIDAGVNYKDIVAILKEENLTLKYIILTHGHVDHVFYMDALRSAAGGSVVIHSGDVDILASAELSGTAMCGIDKEMGKADAVVQDGDILHLGKINLEIIHTPGHTPGSMCIKTGDIIFTGDTLFWESVGRTDLGAGDSNHLKLSLKKLMKLGDDLKAYPGHGQSTTIGHERKNNQFLV